MRRVMVFLQISTVFWICGRITSFSCWLCVGLTLWSWTIDLNKVCCIVEKFKWHLNLQETELNANCIWWWLEFPGGVAWRFKLSYIIETSIWSLQMIRVKPLPGLCHLWDIFCSAVWYIHLCCWCDMLTQVKRNFV